MAITSHSLRGASGDSDHLTTPLVFVTWLNALTTAGSLARLLSVIHVLRFCLDRLRRSACTFAANLNAARLRFFALRQCHAQYTVLVFSSRSFSRNRLRQSEGTRERAVRAFHAMIIIRVLVFFELSLTTQGDHIVFDRQLKVFPFHSGQFGFQHDVVLILINVDAGIPGAASNAFFAEASGQVR